MRGVQIRGITFLEGGACIALVVAEQLLGTDGAGDGLDLFLSDNVHVLTLPPAR